MNNHFDRFPLKEAEQLSIIPEKEMREQKTDSKGRCLALMMGALLLAPSAFGQTVAWGTSASFNPLSFDSDGLIDDESNLWTLGWFADGFTPDALNYDSWASNWNAVSSPTPETDPLPPGGLVNYPLHRLDGLWAVSVNTYDVGTAAAGKQMYVFAYNDLSKIGTEDGEALLYRQDGLLFPSVPNQETFDIANNPLDTNDDNFTVIWGRVDREMENAGGVLVGGGIIYDPKPDSDADPLFGTFEAQFATWIPEPSTALLSALGMLLLMRRRR